MFLIVFIERKEKKSISYYHGALLIPIASPRQFPQRGSRERDWTLRILELLANNTKRFNVDSPWPREDYDGGIGAAMQYNLRPTRHGDSTLSFFGLLYYSKSTPTSPYKCSRSRGQWDKDIQRWVSLTFSINTWFHLHPPIYILALVANEARRSIVEYLWPSVSMHGFTYIPQ